MIILLFYQELAGVHDLVTFVTELETGTGTEIGIETETEEIIITIITRRKENKDKEREMEKQKRNKENTFFFLVKQICLIVVNSQNKVF